MNTAIHSAALVHRFVSRESKGRRYALGRNEHAENVSTATELDGFIDDVAEPGMVWHNKPVVTMSAVPADAIIINCVMAICPVTAAHNSTEFGLNFVLSYSNLCRAFPECFSLPRFVERTRRDYARNKHKWDALSSSLADKESEEVLDFSAMIRCE